MFMKKIKTLLWYLVRPKYYIQFIYLICNELSFKGNARNKTDQKAILWCEQLSTDTNTALAQLTRNSPVETVSHLYPDYFKHAQQKSDNCPVEMGGPGDLNLLYWCAEYLNATKVIETGVAYGWSSLATLLSLKNRNASKLISTDMPYANRNNEQYVGCVVADDIKGNWEILRNADRVVLPKALKTLGTIDMCHYDSDKSYDGRMWAYQLLWDALRPGGFFISDDIGDNIAFHDFTKKIGREPTIIKFDDKFIGVIVKPEI